jgi:tetratricopeptide (TPR) repeat protein
MQRGWEYFNEGQVDTAMYRFNLAWLLNSDNKDAYWAFGLVTANQGKAEEAIGYYEKALTFDANNSLLLSDIASAYLAEYKAKPKKKVLKKAAGYLDKSVAADTSNAFALFNLSKVKFYEKDYPAAWSYLHKSRKLDMAQIDYTFVTEMLAKMPDPEGFFKNN